MLLRRRRIVLLGDSLSVGSFSFMAKALREQADGDNRAFLVAKVGAPTSWMHASEQIAKVLSFDPTVVLVMGGTNDLAANTEGALEGALFHLAGIASTLAEHTGAKVIVSTVPPTSGKARALTERFNAQILKNGIEDTQVQVTNAAAVVLPQDLGPDGIHPTSSGYERLGHALARAAVSEPSSILFAAIPFAVALGALGARSLIGRR